MSVYDYELKESTDCPECSRDDFASFQGLCTHIRRTHNIDIQLRKGCAHCGGDIIEPPRHFSQKGRENFVCSDECDRKHRSQARSGQVTGNEHSKWLGDDLIVECDNCGGSFREKCRRDIREQEHFFCDRECLAEWEADNYVGENNPNWSGGFIRNYGPNWHEQRHATILRDQARCQNCGETEGEHRGKHGIALDVHHKTPIKQFSKEGKWWLEANDLNNLVTLCRRCHQYAEKMAPLYPFGDP